MNPVTGYTRVQIALHWIIALLILLQFLFEDTIVAAWEAIEEGEAAVKSPLVAQHVYGGLLILVLVLWRFALRRSAGVPLPPTDEPPILQFASKVVHGALYLLMLLLPVTGALVWFGGVGASGEVHVALTTLIMVLIGLHVLAVIWHAFVLHSGLLMRMLRPRS